MRTVLICTGTKG